MAGGNREKLTELVEEIEADGGKVSSINLRPDSEENVDAIIKSVVESKGGLIGNHRGGA
jgi:hypothetical protein